MRPAFGRGAVIANRAMGRAGYNGNRWIIETLEVSMKTQQKQTNDNSGLQNANFLTWRVAQAKKRQHDKEITRAYNLRARQRPETKH